MYERTTEWRNKIDNKNAVLKEKIMTEVIQILKRNANLNPIAIQTSPTSQPHTLSIF